MKTEGFFFFAHGGDRNGYFAGDQNDRLILAIAKFLVMYLLTYFIDRKRLAGVPATSATVDSLL